LGVFFFSTLLNNIICSSSTRKQNENGFGQVFLAISGAAHII
jgi:hypothetical protein